MAWAIWRLLLVFVPAVRSEAVKEESPGLLQVLKQQASQAVELDGDEREGGVFLEQHLQAIFQVLNLDCWGCCGCFRRCFQCGRPPLLMPPV